MRTLALAIVGMLCALPAKAQPYIEVTGGGAVFDDAQTDQWTTDFNNASWGATAAAGYCWTSICLEGEALHFRTAVDEGFPLSEDVAGAELGLTGVAGNIVFQIPGTYGITPYVFGGGGLGYVGFDLTDRDGLHLKTGGALNAGDICVLSQGGAGLKMALSKEKTWEVFSEARYVRNDFCSVTGVPHTSATEVIFAGAGLRRNF